MLGTSFEKVPKFRVPVSRPSRTNTVAPGIVVRNLPVLGVYLGGLTQLTEVSGTGIEAVPNLWECHDIVNKRTYQVSGTGIDKVPNFSEVSGTGGEAVPNECWCTRYCGRGHTCTRGIFR